MLEAYTALGYLAAVTSRIELLAWVTAVVYREPGLLAKCVTTLDVISGGRAWLGIGAAWNEQEARGLGLPFPSTAERFERLEEALQICLQMWSGDDSPYAGQHYRLQRTLNSPQPLTRPHPPILIGGGGEKKTLRLVAQYAQACNLFPGPELEHKLDVLREHCEAIGRDYDEIEKTVIMPLDPGQDGEHVDALLERFRGLAALGISHVHGRIPASRRSPRLRSWASASYRKPPGSDAGKRGWAGGWLLLAWPAQQVANADLVRPGQQFGGVSVDPVGAGSFKLLAAVPARQQPDPERARAPGGQQIPDAVPDHHRLAGVGIEQRGRGEEQVRVGLGVPDHFAGHHRRVVGQAEHRQRSPRHHPQAARRDRPRHAVRGQRGEQFGRARAVAGPS